jgi:hypothetical protein
VTGSSSAAPSQPTPGTGKRTEVVEVAPAAGEPAEYPRPRRLLSVMIMPVAFVVAGAGTWYLLGR